jgi:hypothetical protein
MFGFGKKKKQDEFINILADMGNITKSEAESYFSKNSKRIDDAFARGLDPFACVIYIAEANMERIHDAHAIDEPELVADVPDFLLLVALQGINAMQAANVPSAQIDFNFRYWNKVIDLPIEKNKPEFTYGDRLQILVDNLNKSN